MGEVTPRTHAFRKGGMEIRPFIIEELLCRGETDILRIPYLGTVAPKTQFREGRLNQRGVVGAVGSMALETFAVRDRAMGRRSLEPLFIMAREAELRGWGHD